MAEEHVAVFHFFRGTMEPDDGTGGALHVYASVPFVSNASRYRFPYQHESVHPKYRERIRHDVWTLHNTILAADRSVSAPIDTSKHSQIFNPVRQAARSFGQQRYRSALIECADMVAGRLGLQEYIFKFLFSLENQVQLIQICTDELGIPWDWIYSRDRDKFLCELFGVGVTYPDPAQPMYRTYVKTDYSVTQTELASARYSALLIANTYPDSSRPMSLLAPETERLKEYLKTSFGALEVDAKTDVDRGVVLRHLKKNASKLRLIVLSGHFTAHGFMCDDGKRLARDTVRNAFGGGGNDPFAAEPLVILNGCRSSGAVKSEMSSQLDANRDLAHAFLDLGAGACIVTSMDVRLKYSVEFVEGLLTSVLEPGVSLGTALLRTRQKMARDDCYEWAAYHLLGDPTYVMAREG